GLVRFSHLPEGIGGEQEGKANGDDNRVGIQIGGGYKPGYAELAVIVFIDAVEHLKTLDAADQIYCAAGQFAAALQYIAIHAVGVSYLGFAGELIAGAGGGAPVVD